MTDDRWSTIWEIFHGARELSPEERSSFVETRCAGDEALAVEVQQLLAAHESGGEEFLSSAPLLQETPDPQPGDRIGPYRILERLSEGGMGVVFLAEQLHPVQRNVALKLLRAGFDSAEFLARFEMERQSLARMSHAGIARVFDAGVTDRGRPYLVMEHVPGEPILRFADRQRLSTDDRLSLFIRVCEAVQHAHRRGVIHRDLKPSNILVVLEDDRPTPKIIDFGVARAVDRSDPGGTLTEAGRMIGTPEYMSPEQAGLDGEDVDTRTDVYSLGVVLYELLAGAQPFDAGSLRRAGYDEIRRIIREETPPRPSTRLVTLGAESDRVAQSRRTDPPALARKLRGDLDWITMKALEKERDRRYGSPSEFAEDLRSYRTDLPVVARPPSLVYRAGKFVRRHKVGVSAALVVVVALVAGISFGGWGLVRALAAEKEARSEAAASLRIADFMVGLFEGSDPSRSRGREVSARDLLDAGIARIETELADDPEVRARMMGAMGGVYRNLGDYEQALELFRSERELLLELHGETHLDTLRSIGDIAITYWYLERFDEAEPLLRKIWKLR